MSKLNFNLKRPYFRTFFIINGTNTIMITPMTIAITGEKASHIFNESIYFKIRHEAKNKIRGSMIIIQYLSIFQLLESKLPREDFRPRTADTKNPTRESGMPNKNRGTITKGPISGV